MEWSAKDIYFLLETWLADASVYLNKWIFTRILYYYLFCPLFTIMAFLRDRYKSKIVKMSNIHDIS